MNKSGRHDDPTIERKCVPFEMKSVSDEGHGSFEGLGAAFKNLDAVGDIIAPGAFKDGLADFLANGFIGGLGHNWSSPIGHPLAVSETPDGLRIKAVFDGSPEAQSVRAKMTPHPLTGRATVRNLSIGYKTVDAEQLSPAECKSYWQAIQYTPSEMDLARAERGARLLKKLRTIEVSPVLIPANDLARTTGVKSAASADFADHSRKVASAAGEFLSDVESFLRRYESRAEARFKVGREVSAANWNAMKDVHDRHVALREEHGALCELMAAHLERTKPGARAKADGAATETDTPVAAPAIDPEDVAQAYIAYLASRRPRALA